MPLMQWLVPLPKAELRGKVKDEEEVKVEEKVKVELPRAAAKLNFRSLNWKFQYFFKHCVCDNWFLEKRF